MWQCYRSTETGAPVLTGVAGAAITLLDALLVDGYTALTVSSITRSSTTATVTTSTAHGLFVGQRVLIAGADQSDYNGTFTITAVNSSTVFTYTVANSPATPATGTITARRAPAGWTKEFSGTNQAAYRNGAAAKARRYFRVYDDGTTASPTAGARLAGVTGFKSMASVTAGLFPVPPGGTLATYTFLRKSSTADATARAWIAFADDKTLILLTYANDVSGGASPFYMGDIYSLLPDDECGGYISGYTSDVTSNSAGLNDAAFSQNATSTAFQYAFGPPGATAGSQQVYLNTPVYFTPGNGSTGGPGLVQFPNGADGSLWVYPIFINTINNGISSPRGYLRGVYWVLHPASMIDSGMVFEGAGDFSGKQLLTLKPVNMANVPTSSAHTGQVFAFDLGEPPTND